jgi:hypothetical protein
MGGAASTAGLRAGIRCSPDFRVIGSSGPSARAGFTARAAVWACLRGRADGVATSQRRGPTRRMNPHGPHEGAIEGGTQHQAAHRADHVTIRVALVVHGHSCSRGTGSLGHTRCVDGSAGHQRSILTPSARPNQLDFGTSHVEHARPAGDRPGSDGVARGAPNRERCAADRKRPRRSRAFYAFLDESCPDGAYLGAAANRLRMTPRGRIANVLRSARRSACQAKARGPTRTDRETPWTSSRS